MVGNSGGLESMIRFKENFRGNEDDYETLIQEYYNLFKIPGGKYVPPYESVYTDKKGLIMGPSTVATKKFYARAGVEVSNEYKDLPDHIGLEQRFVSHLCDKELKCWIKGDAKGAMTLLALQREFLNDHLMKWISEFRKKVEESTKNDFYKGITRLTEDLIKIDFEMISETLKHFQSL
ncbi:MAG: hypothetical protein GTN80_06455 [Nitrososphaeria archaeon]|nr:hypothetical protein [Nitrososphaeria archaeon]NIQ33268.1 hypothetical protein [Nitrososphaeria archaeon]